MFLPCRPCCGAALAPCPPDRTLITAVEVDLRNDGLFEVLSSSMDGEWVFRTDYSSLTGTYSLTNVGGYLWRYTFPDRGDGVSPYIEYNATFDSIRLYDTFAQSARSTYYTAPVYSAFTTCWLAGQNANFHNTLCTKTFPLLAWNSALVMGQFATTTNLNSGSGGIAQARVCGTSSYDFISWTATGRSGDPNIYYDAVRVYY